MAEPKTYKEERFEFALYVNENLICKRNFRINGFIEHSMESIDFKELVDDIVRDIDNDLKSKSRVYTWYYGDNSKTMQELPREFTEPLLEPWECTFKFVVSDGGKLVIERIWDGYGYPRRIRNNVDIANRDVKLMSKDGNIHVYDKNKFFEDNKNNLTPDLYCLRGMIMDKPDLLSKITKRICEMCSPRDEGYKTTSDYTFIEKYGNDNTTRKNSEHTKSRKYNTNIESLINKYNSDWGKAVAKKTREYVKTLYY